MAPLIQLAAATESRPVDAGDQLLDSVLGENNRISTVTRVLDFLARHDRAVPVTFGDGSQADVQHVTRQVAQAVQKAAAEAEEQKKDLTTVTAPINRLQLAIQNVERARDVLDRARALPGWDETKFQSLVQQAEDMLDGLKHRQGLLNELKQLAE